jgi:hypothetical protein
MLSDTIWSSPLRWLVRLCQMFNGFWFFLVPILAVETGVVLLDQGAHRRVGNCPSPTGGIIVTWRRLKWSLVITSLLPVGCHQIETECHDFMAMKRDECDAAFAWHQCRKAYKGQVEYLEDFAYGFKSGFMNIASGGNGCPPTLPPDYYWSVCMQSGEGECRVQTWFDGYSAGVLEAETRGIRNRNKIPLSNYRKWQLNREVVAPVAMPAGHHGGGVYEVPPAPAVPGVPAVPAMEASAPADFGFSETE